MAPNVGTVIILCRSAKQAKERGHPVRGRVNWRERSESPSVATNESGRNTIDGALNVNSRDLKTMALGVLVPSHTLADGKLTVPRPATAAAGLKAYWVSRRERELSLSEWLERLLRRGNPRHRNLLVAGFQPRACTLQLG